MLGDNLDINVLKYGVICILSLLAFLVVFIIKVLTGSYMIGAIIFVAIVWFLIFKIGITIMYPGSSNYFTADMEMRIGNQLAKNLTHLGHCFQYLGQCIVQKKVQFTASQWNLKEKVLGSIHTTIQMLSMFENNLSDRKAKMLQILRQMLDEIQSRHSYNQSPFGQTASQSLKSISDFMQFPKKIRNTQGQQHNFLCQRIKNVLTLSKDLHQIISTFTPPQKPLQFLKYKFMSEKLYEVRFGYQRWNHVFQYEVHLVKNYGYVLQCAVIKKSRNQPANQLPPAQNPKYVMFCNPNGVYIQFFAVQNTYIREYLRQGYQVILWNYRGYGQSTGSPTITKSQSDAVKVYNYFTDKGMNIQLVHGYSIGGCAAIGLVSKLQQKESQLKHSVRQNIAALRNENLPNNIKLLIVDRSFSSIGDMAIQFGSTIHKLAKVVFTYENKNLSQQFSELKTKKVILWDKRDEVIPDTASVKGGILMRELGVQDQSSCKSCSNCMKQDEQLALNQEVSVLINQREQEDFAQVNRKFVQRFTNSLKILLKNSSQIQKTTDFELNTNHEYDPSQISMQQGNYQQNSNENINLTQQIANQILNSLQFVDGAGSLLPYPVSNFRKLMKIKPLSFEYKCHSYILGLANYGSILPIQVAFKNRSAIQLHTLKKIDDFVINLNKMSDQTNETSKILQPQLSVALQNIRKTFIQVRRIVETNFLLPQSQRFGKLIALNSGHNGSLPQQQLILLMSYARQICTHNQVLNPHIVHQIAQQDQQSSNINERQNSFPSVPYNNSTQNISNSQTMNTFLE